MSDTGAYTSLMIIFLWERALKHYNKIIFLSVSQTHQEICHSAYEFPSPSLTLGATFGCGFNANYSAEVVTKEFYWWE